MMKTKDKLSASVRQAKAGQKSETDVPEAADTAKPAEKATATTKKPQSAPLKQAAPKKPAARKPAAAARKASTATGTRKPSVRKTSQSDEIPESGSALFPKRVWPD
jgi:hypothetical protein